ncbi:hypothetical protein Tco_0284836 [Tanacetum coccineum]
MTDDLSSFGYQIFCGYQGTHPYPPSSSHLMDEIKSSVYTIEMCTGMFKDQDEVVVAQEEVQEKVDLVENEEEELIEEEE